MVGSGRSRRLTTPNASCFAPHSEFYEAACPGYGETYKERRRPTYSVPVLFDTKTRTIVSNDSANVSSLR